jgi:septal ring factor EnvC (AmiA/AmiB activator)
MTLLHPEETTHILKNYQNMSSQQIFDYFTHINHDSDCIYIYRNLSDNLKKEIDIIASEQSKQNDQQIKQNDQQIKQNDQQIKQNDQQIKDLDQQIEQTRLLRQQIETFNKQQQIKSEQILQELEMYRELNRQLDNN